ncbi:fused DSP-PTPase phosphatase/NAD kinase-like protein [Rhodovarius lipocyclicus]|uniref:fused DSP-PTPase phosphatase/NAD kinase-like protein n=1 Tax=Rhodovarius lipocyclicus TaxID=268410 RepID=UPI00135A068E|nr:tyrosine-protein phosphatase [Rhodovarius lipocyclicus]
MRRWLNALFVDHALFRLVWRNWGVVEAGRLYRSNHPLPWQIRAAVRRHGIRTIINLRGHRQDCGADALSRAEAARLGVTLIDAPFESRGAPHRDRIERLVALLPSLREPILIHCKSGADRTGLIAAVWLLLQGRPPAEAMRQLSLRYGHVAAARTGILDAFVALYAKAWPKPFLQWLREDYDEAALRRDFRSRRWADAITDGLLRRE